MAARRKKAKPQNVAARVRHLIALDAENVQQRLKSRLDSMVSLFSRLRDRGPMLAVVHSWFSTIAFSELSALEPHEQTAINLHYELLGELRWYLQYTEDMPGTVQQQLQSFYRKLEVSHRELTSVIGPPDGVGAPVVEARPLLQAVRRQR